MFAEAGKCLLVVVLAFGSVAGPGGILSQLDAAVPDPGVDFRNLQIAFERMLHSNADVNADGVVNVLDVQRMLSQARHTKAPVVPPAATDEQFPCLISQSQDFVVSLEGRRGVALMGAAPNPGRGINLPIVELTSSTKTVRYTFCLISKAPPVTA